MGDEVAVTSYTREDRHRYREKVLLDLDVFGRMLSQSVFDYERPLIGMEIELNLVDESYQPRMTNAEVLERIADPAFQTEIGQYNIELNVEPRSLPGDGAIELEKELRRSLNRAESLANETGAHTVAIGILPTVMPQHLHTGAMSDKLRYAALNEAMVNARGEDMYIDIEGATGEHVAMYADSIAPESACTSVQLHLQVAPQDFAAYWNGAQALSALQLALGANSPYFCGKQLWHETRVELFNQSTDTRSIELKNQGVRPRVFFGERWITSVFDLFEENVRYFPALLPEITDEDPVATLEAGGAPRLSELRAAQRNGLPMEPSGLRHRRREAAPSGREPGSPGRAHDRRHHGQLGLLLRRPATNRPGRPPYLDPDELRCCRAQLPHLCPAWHRVKGLLAGFRGGAGR